MEATEICQRIQSFDPSVGLTVIGRDFLVKWANKVYLRAWPDLVGRVCYQHCNDFNRPCEWCPVKQTFEDKKMHDELVCSPNKKDTGLEWDIVFSNIVSVPIFGEDGEVKEVVEAIFDSTKREKGDLGRRSCKYMALSEFGCILETLKSESQAVDYLLFGVVWEKCLKFPKAELFILEEEEQGKGGELKVREVRTLQRKDCGDVAKQFKTSLSQEQLSSLRGLLKKSVETKVFSTGQRPLLPDALADHYSLDSSVALCGLNSRWPAMRLAPNIVSTKVLRMAGGRSYLLTVLTVGTGHDLTTDRDLLDVGIYGSVAERSLRNRQLAANVDLVLSKCEELLTKVGPDIGALYFAGSVASSFAHDLISSCDILRDQLEFVYSRATSTEKEAMRTYRGIATREIIFMKSCLIRAVDVSRMKKIGIDDFRKYDIHELVLEMRDSYTRLFHRDKIKFSFSPGTKDSNVLCDRQLIKQVLSNLIVNACASLQKTPHRVRELKILTQRSPEFFKIIVEDNGLGIDPSISENIWRPFFSTKRKGTGTGLGLMICKRIVEGIHCGKIDVESKNGSSAIFTVSLPTWTNDG
ncbi:MAG: HAMP domain-containing histidine kinase [Planctomycetes bacterium]|nr:HAMP domain-containing histidine kinase [Planctomycetota bacterium]